MSEHPKVTQRRHGKLAWADYDFAEAGDKIPMHQHDDDACHMTIVLKGSVKVTGDWPEPMILGVGERCIFFPGQKHEIEALEAGTKTMHPYV